ncbi:hypothetical protein C518_0050 [Lysinibacillus fusiformis ZB2]|nr:hypothetical protein C518_0050 [Lysinibacillus fusiformis ZB2]
MLTKIETMGICIPIIVITILFSREIYTKKLG